MKSTTNLSLREKIEYILKELRKLRASITNNSGGGEGIPEAPEDGNIYGRQDGDWTEVAGGTTPTFQQVLDSGNISEYTGWDVIFPGLGKIGTDGFRLYYIGDDGKSTILENEGIFMSDPGNNISSYLDLANLHISGIEPDLGVYINNMQINRRNRDNTISISYPLPEGESSRIATLKDIEKSMDGGVSTIMGDDVTDTFYITHTLGVEPRIHFVTRNSDSNGNLFGTSIEPGNSTEIKVKFIAGAPMSGEPIILNWGAFK